MGVAALAPAEGIVSEIAASTVWSEQQHSWLQAMGYTLYLEGSAMDAPEPVVEPAPRLPVEADVPAAARNLPAMQSTQPPRKAPPPIAASEPAKPAVPSTNAARPSALRLPDRLQIALLRASGCNPNAPETRALMESWPLAELRATPAAKRALWPQLRALRRKQRQ